MNVDELIDAYLEGKEPEAPPELQSEFDRAIQALGAIQYAVGETVIVADSAATVDRSPPLLSSDYEIIRELGCGGMGVVYLARQKSLDRDVAVKVLRPGKLTFGPLVARFLDEAKRLARLRHSNIVSIHEIGQAEDEPYFTMDYVEGESLADRLRRGPLPPTQALAIWKQAAAAVLHAHEHGIIHRDIKPGNILINADGHAFVTDFGLARETTQTSNLTRSGEVLGTPAYMAPEQAQGRIDLVGEATDVHALGVVLYEMLSGRAPYGCDAPADVLARLLRDDPTPLRRIDRRIPRDLETIVTKAMAKNADGRYSTVRAFLDDIERFASGQAITARRDGWLNHGFRWARRRWKSIAAVATAMIVTAIGMTALAPYLFRDSIDRMVADKTTDEIVLLAEEQGKKGDHHLAIRLLRRAMERMTTEQKILTLQKIVAICAERDDAKSLIDAALEAIELQPNLSFGKYDYLVASAAVGRVRLNDVNRSFAARSKALEPHQRLAIVRLEVFLKGPHGSEAQRKDAQTMLAALRGALEPEFLPVGATTKRSTDLPEGTVAELLERARDEKLAAWVRGKAAYAAGRQFEQTGNRDEARAAFELANRLMTESFPVRRGLSHGWSTDTRGVVTIMESDECKLVREVDDADRRYRPQAESKREVELILRVQGIEAPDEYRARFGIQLEPKTRRFTGKDYDGEPEPQRTATLAPGGAIRLAIAPGSYSMTVTYHGASYATSINRIARRIVFDLEETPRSIVAKDATIELPIPARLMEEIELHGPAEGASVDLATDRFSWSPVEGAERYRVFLSRRSDDDRAYLHAAVIDVHEPNVTLGELELSLRKKWAAEFIQGRSIFWSVMAFDASGQQIGISREDKRLFIVVGEMPTE